MLTRCSDLLVQTGCLVLTLSLSAKTFKTLKILKTDVSAAALTEVSALVKAWSALLNTVTTSHLRQVGHLKCSSCNSGTEFLIAFSFNSIKSLGYKALAALT